MVYCRGCVGVHLLARTPPKTCTGETAGWLMFSKCYFYRRNGCPLLILFCTSLMHVDGRPHKSETGDGEWGGRRERDVEERRQTDTWMHDSYIRGECVFTSCLFQGCASCYASSESACKRTIPAWRTSAQLDSRSDAQGGSLWDFGEGRLPLRQQNQTS